MVAIGSGWLALRLTGSLNWLFAALRLWPDYLWCHAYGDDQIKAWFDRAIDKCARLATTINVASCSSNGCSTSGAMGKLDHRHETVPLGVHPLHPTFLARYLHCRSNGRCEDACLSSKTGNSLAVRIPKPLAESANIKEGTVLLGCFRQESSRHSYCKKETIAEANACQGDSEKPPSRSRFRSLRGT
jgi:hypothetical protein